MDELMSGSLRRSMAILAPSGDQAKSATWKAPSVRRCGWLSTAAGAGDPHQPEMALPELLVLDGELTIALFALLARRRLGIRSGERDAAGAVGRPLEALHAFGDGRKGPRFSAFRTDQMDLLFFAAVGRERDPATVRRPPGAGAAPLLGAGELDRR